MNSIAKFKSLTANRCEIFKKKSNFSEELHKIELWSLETITM